jgi:hypothetical protein
MNAQDIGRGPLIAAISAIALLIFMFFSWYGVDSITASGLGFEQEISGEQLEQFAGESGDDTSANAWQAFSLIDILLLILIIGAVALAAARALGSPIDLPIAPSALITGFGVIAFLLILFRLIVTPDAAGSDIPAGVEVDVDVSRKIGVFLGLLAAAGMAIGGWLAMQEEGTSFGDQRDRFAGGPGTGAAPPPGPGPGERPAAPPPPPPPPAAGGGAEPPPPPPPPPRSP